MSSDVNDRIHILLYEEIVSGKYRPYLSKYSTKENLESMVFEANTHKIAVVSKNGNSEFTESDYCYYGFKNPEDYEIITKELLNGKKEIYIRPQCSYELREVMDIPQFVSFKCSSFMALMGDGFERIKIRAEKRLESSGDVNEIKSYASKHVQKSKKLYHDAKHLLKEMQDKKSQDDVYIIFALNLFIIRTILFYQQLFRPYLKTKEETEEQLMSELIKEITWRKLYTLFRCSGKGYCEYLKKSYLEKTDDPENELQEPSVSIEKTFDGEKSQQAGQGTRPYRRIRINCNTNVFIDLYLQKLETIRVKGKPIIETTYENLEDFFVYGFIDKKGKPLSRHTVRTYLKPYRTDKRLKSENPRRIDISEHFKEEENSD